MDLVEYRPEYHGELSKLWAQYDWVAPSDEVLPKKGYVAIENGQPVAAAFVYLSCSGMALLDWVIGDKNASPLTRGKAVYKVLGACKAYAIKEGKKVLYTVTANTALQDTYRKMGFKDMEKGATTLAMSLDGSDLGFLKE